MVAQSPFKHRTIFDNALITKISGFNALLTVSDNLTIQNETALDSILGFENLELIGGSLSIIDNDEMKVIPSFPSLAYIDGDLVINSNGAIENISGFSLLDSIGGDLSIVTNAYRVLSGFEKLQKAKRLLINNSPFVDTINAFQNLRTLDELEMLNLSTALIWTGFDNLEEINGQMFLAGIGDSLESYPSFNNLRYVKDRLILQSFSKEESLNLCNNLEEAGELIIGFNPRDLYQKNNTT